MITYFEKATHEINDFKERSHIKTTIHENRHQITSSSFR